MSYSPEKPIQPTAAGIDPLAAPLATEAIPSLLRPAYLAGARPKPPKKGKIKIRVHKRPQYLARHMMHGAVKPHVVEK